MKKFFFPIGLSIVLISYSNTQQASQLGAAAVVYQKTITLLAPKEFKQQMAAKPGVVLDVRTPGEYKKGFIEGAQLMDIFNDSFDVELAKLDRKKTYYVYCGSGGRSAEAVEKMNKLGFNAVYELEGGYGAWKRAGF